MDRLLANQLANKIINGSHGSGYYEDVDIYGDGVIAGGARRKYKRKRRPSKFNIAVRNYMKTHGATLAQAAHALGKGGSKRRKTTRRRRRGGVGVGVYGGARNIPYESSKIGRMERSKAIKALAKQQYCSKPPENASERELIDFYSKCIPGGPGVRKKAYNKLIEAMVDEVINKGKIPGTEIAFSEGKYYNQQVIDKFNEVYNDLLTETEQKLASKKKRKILG